MVSYEHSLNFHTAEVFGEFLNVVEEAGRLNNNCLSVLFNDENFIINEIVGFVRVQLDFTEVVNVDLALCQLDCLKSILIHNKILLYKWLFYRKISALFVFP